jgi:uncharacterized membrane protein YhaH (DUF805 family)
MSWVDVFFGFHGRINRKTFWAGWICANIAGFALMALLSWIAAGDPASPDVWLTPVDKKSTWVPVWGVWLAVVAWPLAALATKRLHDRERPGWLWYAYYCLTIVFSMPPLKNMTAADLPAVVRVFMPLLLVFAVYLFAELGVMRGTRGANIHGPDTLPENYSGGNHDMLSLLLAWEGRIGRSRWWLGVLINTVIVTAALTVMIVMAEAFFGSHPGLEAKMGDPAWINSADAAPLLLRLALWTTIPMIAAGIAMWSLLALSVKRLHDRGLSSWLILVLVLPGLATMLSLSVAVAPGGAGGLGLPAILFLASLIWGLLQFGILKGESGANQHGPDPLEGQG